MDYRELFTRLNQEINAVESENGPYSFHYAHQLFKNCSWYMAGVYGKLFPQHESKESVELSSTDLLLTPLALQDLVKPSVLLDDKASVEEQVVLPQISSEKDQVLKSLEQFAAEKTKKGELAYSFSGGQLRYKTEQNRQLLELAEDCPELGQYLAALQQCRLCPELAIKDRQEVCLPTLSSFSNGPIKVLFVGDYPKGHAQREFLFSVEAQELLTKMIAAMKLAPAEYAMSLALKCFRSTEDNQIFDQMSQVCLKNIYREIIILKPQVVVTFGAIASNLLLARKERMVQIHGQVFDQTIRFHNDEHQFQIIPTFHPDFLLSSPGNKKVAWEDLQRVMKMIGKL